MVTVVQTLVKMAFALCYFFTIFTPMKTRADILKDRIEELKNSEVLTEWDHDKILRLCSEHCW
jgi:hypothetical protein